MVELTRRRQKAIASRIRKTDTDFRKKWDDYKWQLQHVVNDIDSFMALTGISLEEKELSRLEDTVSKFPLSITPHYLSLIDVDNYRDDPVFRQSFPDVRELDLCPFDMGDPLHEEHDSPVEGITHRYPDRVLFWVSGVCAMYCRHCTRKRKVGDTDRVPDRETILKGIDYVRENRVVRDVLLSGGDPFLLSDERLDWILGELSAIEHVEIVRIGTRTPVVLPQRITPQLVSVLKKHHPVWINTHFNHPRELTESSEKALSRLANAGIPLGNQSVLLSGVNDCPRIMKRLNQRLVQNRVRPYYLYQCDLSEGLTHFRTPVGKGIEIIESLVGHTSGMCVPTYVIDAPGGGGKIPIMPNYIVSWSTNKVVLRNYEGIITTYKEPDSYEPVFCDRNCEECDLQLSLEGIRDSSVTGVAKLLLASDGSEVFDPYDAQRLKRRTNGGEG